MGKLQTITDGTQIGSLVIMSVAVSGDKLLGSSLAWLMSLKEVQGNKDETKNKQGSMVMLYDLKLLINRRSSIN